jgi:hypothetical protein
MISQTLTALANDVEHLLLAGAAVAAADERLPAHARTLQQLGQRLPPLRQLAEAVERVGGKSATEAAAPLLDLLVLVRQLRANLAETGMQGNLWELKEFGPWETPAPISELQQSIDNDYYRSNHVNRLPRVLSDLRYKIYSPGFKPYLLED